MKSGNLNFLEPSGPLQACNETVLPLPLPLILRMWNQKFVAFEKIYLPVGVIMTTSKMVEPGNSHLEIYDKH